MKKICLLASFIIIFLLSFNIVFAQEVSPTPTPQVDYELPYPGLLPDSPIYFLRIIRDRMVGFLISDPLKKSEFDLLQADKRFNAGIYLFNKGKIAISISTISKAENYFGEALEKTKKARNEGMEVSEITRKLVNSAKKHQEVLKSLAEKSPQNFKASFGLQLQRANNFEKEAIALALK